MGGQGGEVWLETVRKYEKINSVLISCGGIWLQFFLFLVVLFAFIFFYSELFLQAGRCVYALLYVYV